MKLLFDENLSQRLVQRLEASFPGSVHVELIGLHAEPDQTIWDYAGLHGLTIRFQADAEESLLELDLSGNL